MRDCNFSPAPRLAPAAQWIIVSSAMQRVPQSADRPTSDRVWKMTRKLLTINKDEETSFTRFTGGGLVTSFGPLLIGQLGAVSTLALGHSVDTVKEWPPMHYCEGQLCNHRGKTKRQETHKVNNFKLFFSFRWFKSSKLKSFRLVSHNALPFVAGEMWNL